MHFNCCMEKVNLIIFCSKVKFSLIVYIVTDLELSLGFLLGPRLLQMKDFGGINL